MQQTDTTNHIPQPPIIEPAANPEPPPLSIVDYLLVIVRHKKMILYTTFGAALLTAVRDGETLGIEKYITFSNFAEGKNS